MIYILAPIGGGKTSLTHLLSKELGAREFLEKVDGMPMLKEFYSAGEESRKALGFPLQVSFLNFRYSQLRQALELKERGIESIMDSSLLSDSLMYKNIHDRGETSDAEYNLYLELLENMQANVSGHPFHGYPDLIIYLDMPFKLMLKHIQHRGRAMEDITKDPELVGYYHSVWELFNNWAKSYSQSPMLSVDMSKYDYVNNEEDKNFVLNMIDDKLVSLGLLTPAKKDELLDKRGCREVALNV